MRRIAIINQKGGVGKTTTTVNVGAALARAGHRVLMIDLDPQAHLSLHVGHDPQAELPSAYDLLTGNTTISKARRKAGANLWLVPSSIDLAGAEVELVSTVGREVILRDLLDQHLTGNGRTPSYDYVLMDCPPSLSVLTLNGLCAAREVIIPLQPHYLALQGLGKLLETVALVNQRINPALKVSGVALCMHETGTKLAGEVVDDVRAFFDGARGTGKPWAETRVFDSVIRRNIKLAESPSYGQSIFDYAPDSNGAKDYESLGAEIARMPAPGQPSDAPSADSIEAASAASENESPVSVAQTEAPAEEESPPQGKETGGEATECEVNAPRSRSPDVSTISG
jgi:chromosome partitioning protein